MLPKGFISVEDAIALVQANTAEKPTVDIAHMATNAEYIQVGKNFTIHLPNGTTWVYISKNSEKAMLEEAIQENVRKTRGIDLQLGMVRLRKNTTVVDTEKNPQGRILPNPEDKADYSTSMGAGLM